MMSRIRKTALLGTLLLPFLFGVAYAASKSDAADLPDPSPGSVLEGVYGEKGDGSASYSLPPERGGSLVSLWYNYRFKVAGHQYYTGFTVLEPVEGSAEEGLLFGQLTYQLDTYGGKSFWTLFHGDNALAEFPGVMKAEKVDANRPAVNYVTSDQHLVLAVPTTAFESGETVNNYMILMFDPRKNDLGDYKSWRYLGSVPAGGENSANCGDDLPTPCVSSTGTVSFVPPKSGTMPFIRMSMTGTEVVGPGKTRALGANDAINYAFNRKTGQYEQAAGK